MSAFEILMALSSGVELVLLAVIFYIFSKLRKSEEVLLNLQTRQDEFVARLDATTRLEGELVSNFSERQEHLVHLEHKLQERARELERLLAQAEQFSRSPTFLRQVIVAGLKQGKSLEELSRKTGLSKDEIEIISGQGV